MLLLYLQLASFQPKLRDVLGELLLYLGVANFGRTRGSALRVLLLYVKVAIAQPEPAHFA